MDEERKRRVGLNEALFRDVNERMKEMNETFATFSGTMEIVCECGASDCLERITIPPDDYERLRADSTTFAVVPGHETSNVEVVVQRGEYDVIRKLAGWPATVAEQTDPRSGA